MSIFNFETYECMIFTFTFILCFIIGFVILKRNKNSIIKLNNEKEKEINVKKNEKKEEKEIEKQILDLINEKNISDFDLNLRNLLVEYEKKGGEMTISIQNTILECLIKINRFSDSELQFDSMKQYNQINKITYLILLSKYNQEEDLEKIQFCIKEIENELNLIKLNAFLLSNLIIAYGKIDNLNKSIYYFDLLLKECPNNEYYFNISTLFLIDILFQKKKLDEIMNIYNKIKKLNFDKEILKLLIKTFQKMKKYNEIKNLYLIKKENKIENSVLELFIESFVKGNFYEEANEIFYSLKIPSIISYGNMLTLYSKEKNLKKCEKIFNEMKTKYANEMNIIPYQLIIKTNINNNKINEGLKIFDSMINSTKIKPDKLLYELIINSSLKNNLKKEAFNYLIMSINDNIKLSKYIYEDIIDEINDSDIIEKDRLIYELNDYLKNSNFVHESSIMNKLKIIIEKDSITSIETSYSYIKSCISTSN